MHIQAKAVSTAKINESITPNLLKLNAKLDEYEKSDNDEFIIIDVSSKLYFDNIVSEHKIVEIIDHHVGYEEYWKNKLGERSIIEFIGAAATLVVELYEKENLIKRMSKDIAYLLMSAILDNTLNFKAKITTDRDKNAYRKLQLIVGDENNYTEKYFKECQSAIERNLKSAIENDTKIEKVSSKLPPIFGQIILWDKEKILKNKDVIYNTLNDMGEDWMINLVCLEEGKSYIIASNLEVKVELEKLLNGKFNQDIMELEDVWLRKEIIKKATR